MWWDHLPASHYTSLLEHHFAYTPVSPVSPVSRQSQVMSIHHALCRKHQSPACTLLTRSNWTPAYHVTSCKNLAYDFSILVWEIESRQKRVRLFLFLRLNSWAKRLTRSAPSLKMGSVYFENTLINSKEGKLLGKNRRRWRYVRVTFLSTLRP